MTPSLFIAVPPSTLCVLPAAFACVLCDVGVWCGMSSSNLIYLLNLLYSFDLLLLVFFGTAIFSPLVLQYSGLLSSPFPFYQWGATVPAGLLCVYMYRWSVCSVHAHTAPALFKPNFLLDAKSVNLYFVTIYWINEYCIQLYCVWCF